MTIRKEQIGDCTLYLGDCLEVMPTLGKVDAVVTDPPYGINQDGGFSGSGIAGARREYEGGWDTQRPDKELFIQMIAISNVCIVWGGNYFTDLLPQANKWLVWDKEITMPTYSQAELAWTNLNGNSVKHIRYNNNGMMAKEKERVHPTQKPVGVMTWCIKQLPDEAKSILDPFMGSGTTGVACAKLGRKFIGIELEPKYFDIACKRIERAYAQPDMFVEAPKKPVQEVLV